MGTFIWLFGLAREFVTKLPVVILAFIVSKVTDLPFLWSFVPVWMLAALVRTYMMFKGDKKDLIGFVNGVAYWQIAMSLFAMFMGSEDAVWTMGSGIALSAATYFVVERYSGGQLTAFGRVWRTKKYTGRAHEEAIGDEDGSGASFHDGRDDGVFTQGGR